MNRPGDALLVSARFLHHPPPQPEPWQQSLENYAARNGLAVPEVPTDPFRTIRPVGEAEPDTSIGQSVASMAAITRAMNAVQEAVDAAVQAEREGHAADVSQAVQQAIQQERNRICRAMIAGAATMQASLTDRILIVWAERIREGEYE